MGIIDIIKPTRKTFFDPAGWLDVNWLRFQNRTVMNSVRNLYTPEQPLRQETFAEAMQRLNMSDKEVDEAGKFYCLLAIIFLLLGIALLGYSFYLLVYSLSFFGFLIGMGATAVLFSQAFKYDFWSLQMKKRTLGLTFADWKRHLVGK